MIEYINRSKEVNNFKLIKLINGEDIICSIEDGNPNKANSFIEVVYPLRMQIIPKMNNDHKITESLSTLYRSINFLSLNI